MTIVHTVYGNRLLDLQPRCSNAKEIENALSKQSMYRLQALPAKRALNILNYAVGIEVEAENAIAFPSTFWEITTDGSLRDRGLEFQSKYGNRVHHSAQGLHELYARAALHKFSFSERTSVHIHIDVRMASLEDINCLLALYVLFENAFFRYAGARRKHNIFCVPFRDSIKCRPMMDVNNMIQNAEKYSAINFNTITTFGTVEFRHMEGNADPDKIFNWIMLIGLLKNYACNVTKESLRRDLVSLKTTSMFNHFVGEVFGPYVDLLTTDSREIDEAISDSKLFL